MLMRPEQIKLLRLGLSATLANEGGSSESQANTSTTNTSSTVNQDRRIVADNGALAISADSSSVSVNITDQGAIAAANKLTETGASMVKMNTDLAAHLADGNSGLISSTLAQQQAALQVVASVVSKPLDMNDPQHKLVAVGMAVVAVVAVMAFKKG